MCFNEQKFSYTEEDTFFQCYLRVNVQCLQTT